MGEGSMSGTSESNGGCSSYTIVSLDHYIRDITIPHLIKHPPIILVRIQDPEDIMQILIRYFAHLVGVFDRYNGYMKLERWSTNEQRMR